MPYCDIVIGNEAEAEAWAEASGQPNKTDLPAIARALALTPKANPSRPRTVIITHGAESTVVFSAAEGAEPKIHSVHALKEEDIVDTNVQATRLRAVFLVPSLRVRTSMKLLKLVTRWVRCVSSR